MNLTAQEYLARLLAKENLTVQHGNYHTASFDMKERVLRLPLWKDKGKCVYDLLVGHEVGHALYTPADGWHEAVLDVDGAPRDYLNVVEDIRIERKIQESYPGIKKSFKAGYKILFDDNMFGTKDRTPTSFMDRLNVLSKGRGLVPIEFTDEEQPFVDEAMLVETWDDVVVVCKKINEFLNDKKEKENEEQETEEGGQTSDESADQSNEEDGEGEGDAGQKEGQLTEGQFTKEQFTKEQLTEEQLTEEQLNESFTDKTFREKETELLEGTVDDNGEVSQPLYSSGMSPTNIERCVVPYSELLAARNSSDPTKHNYVYSDYVTESYNKEKVDLDRSASLLAKEFERKKAAFEYSRSTVSKTGSLNMNKIHQYKYSEDVFLSVSNLATAKSHGIVMFVDLSGSMCGIVEDVISQSIMIAMFCRKVNIPFDVYTFTTTGSSLDRAPPVNPSELISRLCLVQSLSSSMKKLDFARAARDFYGMGMLNGMANRRVYSSDYLIRYIPYDNMGTTPLIETVIVAEDIVSKFQKKYKIQKTNVMFLTDGGPNCIDIMCDDSASDSISTERSAYGLEKVAINFKGKMVTGRHPIDIYNACLNRLKVLTGCKVTGFFLADNNRDLKSAVYSACSYSSFGIAEKKITDVRKNSITNLPHAAYDDYFLVSCGGKKSDGQFEPQKTEKISDIRNEFKKFNRNKKAAKQIVIKISDCVAA